MTDAARTPDPTYDPSILSTDFAPDGAQAQMLRAEVAGQKSEISVLSSQLNTLQLRAHELRSRIGDIEGTLSVNEALLSPGRRLAPELLGEVFMHCLPNDEAVTASPRHAPLLLTQVCRRWRRVACGTPRLWQKLYLGRGFCHELCTLVPLWLHNSGKLPLDIHTSIQDWANDLDPRLLERDLTRLLAPNIHRCRSFAGSMSSYAIEQLFGRDILLPHLESLELWLPIWSTAVVPNLGILQAPCLRSITLNDTGFVTEALPGPLPSVRQLRLTGQDTFGLLSHSSCLDFISLCLNVQSCTLTLSKDPGPTLHSPVVLESLRHLHLIFHFSPHDPIPFLKSLLTPRIERLTLQNHGGVSPVPHIRRVLNLLLSVRPHTIKELNLYSIFVPTSDWVPSLRELSALTSLSIVGDSLDESFFDALTAKGSSPWSCPRLTSLKLHHVSGLLGPSGDRLVAFIRSRAPIGPDGRSGIEEGYDLLQYVSLTLCDLERRHEVELRDIERRSHGSLRLDGLGLS